MKITGIVATLGVAALAVATPCHAQAQPLRGDDALLAGYTLTVPKVKAWAAAGVAVAEAQKAHAAAGRPQQKAQVDANGTSIDDMAATMDGIPEVRRAIRRSGLTSREFSIISLVVIQAMMTASMMESNPRMAIPKNLNPANVAFARANKQLIQDSLRALRAANESGKKR